MTIFEYDSYAILPKRCDDCNRLFWLEPYNISYRDVLLGFPPIKYITCINCIHKR